MEPGSADDFDHRPVLLDRVIQALAVREGGCYIDCTGGGGGHSSALLQSLGCNGRLLIMDRDPFAIETLKRRFSGDRRVTVVHSPFDRLNEVLAQMKAPFPVAGVLLDLGVSSPQLDQPGRGFSFRLDGPLDMRMDPESGESAAHWLSTAEEAELVQVIRELGEERHARRVARAIVRARETQAIETTSALARIVEGVVPSRGTGKHPATRVFRALRMVINQELEQLERVLPQALDCLQPRGRLVVLSFHSLEDRIVKRFMRHWSTPPQLPRGLPLQSEWRRRLRILKQEKKAGAEEVLENPRARSAVLRVAEKIEASEPAG